jgi:acid phosphatase family membrane protein YuiD
MELNFFYEHLYLIPAITFFIAVLFKLIYIKFCSWRFNIERAIWSWWMPSVHSAVITSLAAAVTLKYWLNSDLFAISITLAFIVIYDAVNVRYEAGRHARYLNKMMWKDKFKESLGHLPSEAFAWSILWIIIPMVLYFV